MELTEIKKKLSYNPRTGEFIRIVSAGRNGKVGTVAGSIHPVDGYVLIQFGGRKYRAHRLAFLFMTGEWPKLDVDHINRVRSDNRWSNLRQATRSQNSAHRAPRADRTSLVGTLKIGQRYQAAICVRENGKKRRIHLGMFGTAEEAHAVYLNKARLIYGKFKD